jgi:hypothetical protein
MKCFFSFTLEYAILMCKEIRREWNSLVTLVSWSVLIVLIFWTET